jgi:hypothetical protein
VSSELPWVPREQEQTAARDRVLDFAQTALATVVAWG